MVVSLVAYRQQRPSGRTWRMPEVWAGEDFRQSCRGWGFRLGVTTTPVHVIRWQAVANAVSKVTKIPLAVLLGHCRERRYIEARWIVMLLLVESGFSYAAIGRRLGRDHTTIMHGHKRAKELLLSEAGFLEIYSLARAELRSMDWVND